MCSLPGSNSNDNNMTVVVLVFQETKNLKSGDISGGMVGGSQWSNIVGDIRIIGCVTESKVTLLDYTRYSRYVTNCACPLVFTLT